MPMTLICFVQKNHFEDEDSWKKRAPGDDCLSSFLDGECCGGVAEMVLKSGEGTKWYD